MTITKDTVVCISIAERPGNFGASLFNPTFEKLNLDYVYKPFRVSAEDLPKVFPAIRALGIRGCGVSMPHKQKVMEFLDAVDPLAQKIGAVNTIINEQGKLTGYNTDVLGAEHALDHEYDVKGKKVLLVGAGGAARAIIVALKERGVGEITIVNRDESKAKELAASLKLNLRKFSELETIKADLFVNATPVGMSPQVEELIIAENTLDNFSAVMDVVVSPLNTKLIEIAKKKGKIVVPGYKMSLYQAAAQFKLYTGVEAPLEMLETELWKLVTQ